MRRTKLSCAFLNICRPFKFFCNLVKLLTIALLPSQRATHILQLCSRHCLHWLSFMISTRDLLYTSNGASTKLGNFDLYTQPIKYVKLCLLCLLILVFKFWKQIRISLITKILKLIHKNESKTLSLLKKKRS